MRRQIGLLTAATTSAVVLAFVIPLCLLVRTLAEDRALANADQEARNVAILVSGLHADPALARLVAQVDARSESARTSVLMADGRTLGSPDARLSTDPAVARAGNGEAFTTVDDTGARILVPVVTEDGTSVIRTSVSSSALHQGGARAWASFIGLGTALLLAALFVAARLGRRISTPVTDLAGVAHRLREGDLDARADPAGPSETVELGVALNRLAERITELLAAERAAVGDLAHRLRTPVTALRLDVEAVRDPQLTARLQEHVEHLQRTVDAVDLCDVVDILVDNIFAHTPEGTGFRIALAGDPGDGGVARLTVQDFGPGVAATPDEGQRLGSSGLGQQIVRRAVSGFGGDVTFESTPGRGVRVVVVLPGSPPAR